MIKGYHTDNGIFNASEFMEWLYKKQQNISFIGSGASHQNGAAERAIKVVFTMRRTMLMHAALRCPKDTLSTDIWPMMYGSTIGSLTFSLYYLLFKYGQGQCLRKYQKPLATVVYGVFQHIFLNRSYTILE